MPANICEDETAYIVAPAAVCEEPDCHLSVTGRPPSSPESFTLPDPEAAAPRNSLQSH